MPSKVYWDSCCFIGLLQQEEDKVAALTDLLRKAEAEDMKIVTSALTIAEVFKLPDTGLQPEDQAQKILSFLENDHIVLQALDRKTAERANTIAWQQGVKPLDAIHLATGILTGCGVFYTYDGGLLTHDEAAWVQPMRIKEPPDPEAGTLFAKRIEQAPDAAIGTLFEKPPP